MKHSKFNRPKPSYIRYSEIITTELLEKQGWVIEQHNKHTFIAYKDNWVLTYAFFNYTLTIENSSEDLRGLPVGYRGYCYNTYELETIFKLLKIDYAF